MTTQSTASPETHLPQTRGLPKDGDIRSAKDTHESFVPELKERIKHVAEDGKTRVAEWKGGFQESIRAQPIQSVLIASAVGAVIGLVFGRRG